MKSKIISLFLLTTILTILTLAVVSAAVLITKTTPASLTESVTQTNFTITNSGNESVNIQLTALPLILDDGKTHQITVTSSSSLSYTNLTTGQNTGLINLAYTGDTANFLVGEYTKNIVAIASQVGNSTNIYSLDIPVKFVSTFCKSGDIETADQTLSISSVDIRNDDGDDTEWNPLDTLTVKVKVENTGNEKVTSVYVELGLFNSDGKNVVSNLDDLTDKKVSLGTITDGKEKTNEFKFKIPTDFKEDNYRLVIKAYKSGKEIETCASSSSDLDKTYYQTISSIRESETDKHVVVDKIVLSPEETAQCGDKVQISADVVNIGDEDYLDQFKVTLYNKELGIDLKQEIKEDLDQGDSYTVDFEFDVPAKAAEKSHELEFRTYYDFDDSDNTYNEISSKKFFKTIKIAGNCQPATTTPTTPQLKISAQLDPETPEAVPGKQVVIQTTLKNLGSTDSTYSLSVYGNSAWSSLVSIDPQTITLAAGQSKDVSIILNIDQAAQGDKEFTIRAVYGAAGEKAVEQKVALTIAAKAQATDYQAVVNHFKNNWFIYLIVLVNVILIIAIIVVIRRMVSSPREYQ